MSNTNGRKQWAFDFSDIKKAKDLFEIGKKVKTPEGVLDELAKRTVSWPAEGDPKNLDDWGELDIPVWIEGQERFLEAYQNFLSAQKGRN